MRHDSGSCWEEMIPSVPLKDKPRAPGYNDEKLPVYLCLCASAKTKLWVVACAAAEGLCARGAPLVRGRADVLLVPAIAHHPQHVQSHPSVSPAPQRTSDMG